MAKRRIKREHATAHENTLHVFESNQQPRMRKADTQTEELNPMTADISLHEFYSLHSLAGFYHTGV